MSGICIASAAVGFAESIQPRPEASLELMFGSLSISYFGLFRELPASSRGGPDGFDSGRIDSPVPKMWELFGRTRWGAGARPSSSERVRPIDSTPDASTRLCRRCGSCSVGLAGWVGAGLTGSEQVGPMDSTRDVSTRLRRRCGSCWVGLAGWAGARLSRGKQVGAMDSTRDASTRLR